MRRQPYFVSGKTWVILSHILPYRLSGWLGCCRLKLCSRINPELNLVMQYVSLWLLFWKPLFPSSQSSAFELLLYLPPVVALWLTPLYLHALDCVFLRFFFKANVCNDTWFLCSWKWFHFLCLFLYFSLASGESCFSWCHSCLHVHFYVQVAPREAAYLWLVLCTKKSIISWHCCTKKKNITHCKLLKSSLVLPKAQRSRHNALSSNTHSVLAGLFF